MLVKRLLTAALVAGFATGFLSAILQLWLTVPQIIQAESFETLAQTQTLTENDGHQHTHALAGGIKRHLLTIATTIVTFCGFAMIMASMMIITRPKNKPEIPENTTIYGILWGIATGTAITLAPAIGLPPELPSMQTASLHDRQIWWLSTIILTSISLWLATLAPLPKWKYIIALIIIIAPHIISAPHPQQYSDSPLPAELAASFVARSIAIAMLSWTMLGLITAKILYKPSRPSA